MNRLHVRTRQRTVHDQLLFARGDRWSEALARETERNLRALDFLTPNRIVARREGDSAAVRVETRDQWTTSPEFNLESADRKQYGSVSFSERNLLGLGKSISIAYREDPSGITRSVSYDDPNVLDSRMRLRYGAGSGSAGASNRLTVGLPFYAEDAPTSYGFSWSRATWVVRLYQRAEQIADLDQRLEEAELFWGVGRRRGGVVRRVVGSFLAKDRRLGPSRLEPGAPAEFAGGESSLRQRRVGAEAQLWRPEFVERVNVDLMTLVEDFGLGESIALKLGIGPRFLGSTADEGFVHVRLGAGTESPFGFGWLRAGATSRLRGGPREIVAQLDARWIHQSLGRQTLVLAAHATSGWRTDRDFQVIAGGLNGLRAYPVQAVAGRRLLRLNVEDRWIVWQNFRDIFAVGAVVFADAARAGGAGAGGGGWFTSAGTGLRVSMPRWSPSQLLRFDVAWPVSPTRDGRRAAVLSFGSSQAF